MSVKNDIVWCFTSFSDYFFQIKTLNTTYSIHPAGTSVMAMKAQLIMMVMMINALNNVRSVKETVIRHMDEPKFKLMLYRAGAINVTSTECTNQPCKTRTDKQI